jgi:hypothetical protein
MGPEAQQRLLAPFNHEKHEFFTCRFNLCMITTAIAHSAEGARVATEKRFVAWRCCDAWSNPSCVPKSANLGEQEENMRKTFIALAILAPVATFAATKPVGCALLDEAACTTNRACAWSPPMVRGEKSPTTGKPYKFTRRGYCHRRPLRSASASSATAAAQLSK